MNIIQPNQPPKHSFKTQILENTVTIQELKEKYNLDLDTSNLDFVDMIGNPHSDLLNSVGVMFSTTKDNQLRVAQDLHFDDYHNARWLNWLYYNDFPNDESFYNHCDKLIKIFYNEEMEIKKYKNEQRIKQIQTDF